MNEIFWLRAGYVAGRSGPNKNPWRVEEFKSAGFAGVLSVNDAEAVHESLIQQQGLVYAHIPLSDNAPPRKGDLALCLKQLPKAVDFIRENKASGPVLVHCRSGKDRTGLVMAAYLMATEGLSVEQAIEAVFAVRPIAFSAPGWREFAVDVLSAYQ